MKNNHIPTSFKTAAAYAVVLVFVIYASYYIMKGIGNYMMTTDPTIATVFTIGRWILPVLVLILVDVCMILICVEQIRDYIHRK